MPKRIDRTGERFGRLLVLGLAGISGHDRLCRVLCDCGVEKEIKQTSLTTKTKPVRSCGCLIKDSHFSSHNLTGDAFYPIWKAMVSRCYKRTNKSYKTYGGRGINVCNEWKESPVQFIAWLKDNGYRQGLQIDRVDNDGNYSPDNCRVTTAAENSRNRSNNVKLSFKGESILLVDLAKNYGIEYGTMYARIFRMGLSPEKAVLFNRQGAFA